MWARQNRAVILIIKGLSKIAQVRRNEGCPNRAVLKTSGLGKHEIYRKFTMIDLHLCKSRGYYLKDYSSSSWGINWRVPSPKSLGESDRASNRAIISRNWGFPRVDPISPLAIIKPQ